MIFEKLWFDHHIPHPPLSCVVSFTVHNLTLHFYLFVFQLPDALLEYKLDKGGGFILFNLVSLVLRIVTSM